MELVPSSSSIHNGDMEKILLDAQGESEGAVQEAVLTATALPHKKMGRSCLVWKCTPARSLSSQSEEEAAEGEKEVDVLKKV